MRIFNMQEIRLYDPCCDPTRYASKDWSGTVLDVLNHPDIKPQDKVWVVSKFGSDKPCRLFAVHCARTALKIANVNNSITKESCRIARQYALNKISINTLLAQKRIMFDDLIDKVHSRTSIEYYAYSTVYTALSRSAYGTLGAWAGVHNTARKRHNEEEVKRLSNRLIEVLIKLAEKYED